MFTHFTREYILFDIFLQFCLFFSKISFPAASSVNSFINISQNFDYKPHLQRYLIIHLLLHFGHYLHSLNIYILLEDYFKDSFSSSLHQVTSFINYGMNVF